MKNVVVPALLSCAMALTTAAYSQTWVSNSGTDAGTCPITAPCRTFAYAVTQTPAWGQLSVLNAGDYGSVTITQAIRIDGGGFATNVATAGNNGITVNTPAGSVVQLHNLSIHGATGGDTGIVFCGSGGLDIDNVQITGFAYGIIDADSLRIAVSNMVINNTTIENIAYTGIYIAGTAPIDQVSAKIVNTHVRFSNNGLFASYSTVSTYNSTFSSPGGAPWGPQEIGINAVGASVLLDGGQVTGYYYGIESSNGANVQVSRMSFIANYVPLYPNAGGAAASIVSNGNNSFFGNGSQSANFTQTVGLQ
jgi:hypothetical protein